MITSFLKKAMIWIYQVIAYSCREWAAPARRNLVALGQRKRPQNPIYWKRKERPYMHLRRLAVAVFVTAIFTTAPGWAQSSAGTDNPLVPLCAPYALYPDTLLAQVLAASTYPDQVMAASVWCTEHPGTTGDALTTAMNSQPWDNSVKALCTFPDVLQKMTSDMNNTTALGQDFLNEKAEVMDCVQGIRAQAQTMGALETTPQQKVVSSGSTIEIVPANPSTIYVPTYDPTAYYSSTVPYGAGMLAFGTGVALGAAYTNNYGAFNWANHGMYMGSSVYAGGVYHAGGVYGGTAAWSHSYGYAHGYNGAAYHSGTTGVYRGPAGNTSVYHRGTTAARGYGGGAYHSGSAFATTAGGGFSSRYASRGYSSMGGSACHFGGRRR